MSQVKVTKGVHVCSKMLIVFHVQTELSLVVASLSIYSARVNVVAIVVVHVSCWTEPFVVRNTTKISNSVSSCSSPVPSPALSVGPSNQCAVVRVCHLCHAVCCVVSCVVWCGVLCVRVFMWWW